MTNNEWRITHIIALKNSPSSFFYSSHDLTWRRRLIHWTDSARREQLMSIIRHNFLILIRYSICKKQKESGHDCRADGVVRKNVRTTAKMISKCKNVRAKFFLTNIMSQRENVRKMFHLFGQAVVLSETMTKRKQQGQNLPLSKCVQSRHTTPE